MKIHEYQGKEFLRAVGVPVPRGYPAFTVREAQEAAQKLGGSVWVVKAQIHAGGRGKGGGVKLARSLDEVEQLAGQILGMQLKTHQTGPEGQKVRRLLIEEGADIKKEYYVAALTDRATQSVALMASSEGGMDIEEVAHKTPEKIIKVFVDPLVGLTDAQALELAARHRRARRPRRPRPSTSSEALRLLHGHRRLAGRDQPADPGRQRPHQGAGREVQLRRQRAVPPPRDRGLPRPRRGRPGRGRGQQVRPQLHQPGRQHRLPGQRRRPGDGHHGHHQAVRRRAGQLPRRRRRRHRREGDRGLQDHAQERQGQGHPGQHLRRHHEVRHHRRGRDRGLQGGQPVACRWSCA